MIISLLTRAYSIFCNFQSCLLDNTWYDLHSDHISEPQKIFVTMKGKSVFLAPERHFSILIVRYYFTSV